MPMFALPLKADICSAAAHVRFGLEAVIQYFFPVDPSQCRYIQLIDIFLTFYNLSEGAQMKSPLETLFIAGLAAMALMLAIPVRARSFMLAIPAMARSLGPQKGVAPCDSQTNDKKFSVEATKQTHVLISWIASQTHWTFQETPPIDLIPSEEIQKRYTAEDPTSFQIGAFYSVKDRTIYLPDSWRSNTLRDRSILLHELVHHLQYLNHVKVTCETEREFQAFKLQAAWLSEQGVEYPLDLMGVDLRYILMLSHCPEF